jgi:hypothetical protein
MTGSDGKGHFAECQRALILIRAKLYEDTRRPQCCALLKLPFPVQCSRHASVERGGRFYCGLHDPRRPVRRIMDRDEGLPKKLG